MIEKYEQPEGRIESTLPIALPLKRNNKLPIRRHGSDYYEEKGKDTKISKIFQLAVTALSFLAFGGYLLTLIITAIRRNTNSTGNGNVIVFSVKPRSYYFVCIYLSFPLDAINSDSLILFVESTEFTKVSTTEKESSRFGSNGK